MSGREIHEAQQLLRGKSIAEVREMGSQAKQSCVTIDEYGGEVYDPGAASLPMYLAAKSEMARRFEVNSFRTSTR
jgi:hypothetical protein